MLFYLFY